MALKKKHLSYIVIGVVALVIILGIFFTIIFPGTSLYEETPQQNSTYSRYYVSQSSEECQTLLFQCEIGHKPFFNERGCGCEPTGENIEEPSNETYCDPENRPEVCAAIYHPVCGYFDETTQCVREPCASTFSNDCSACASENVEYWIDGACS